MTSPSENSRGRSENKRLAFVLLLIALVLTVAAVMKVRNLERRVAPKAEEAAALEVSPKSLLMLSYTHERQNIFYLGTLMRTGEEIWVKWTVSQADEKKQSAVELSLESFGEICSLLNDTEVFGKYRVKAPDTKLDFTKNHVVGVAVKSGESFQVYNYLIPDSFRDARFLNWLRLIRLPVAVIN